MDKIVKILLAILNFKIFRKIYARLRKYQFSIKFPGNKISGYAEIPEANIKIGRGTYGTPKILTFTPQDTVIIGNYCSIGPEVLIVAGGEHKLDVVSSYPLRFMLSSSVPTETSSKGPIRIGNDVWIGARTIIVSGVKIGDGAVIGAGSVIVHDIPPYSIAVGNPAKVKKLRFNEEQIEQLLKISWWNWPEQEIKKNISVFYSSVDEFIKMFSS